MHFNILQFILIIASIIFFIFGIDLYKRKKATILHYIIFIGGTFLLIFFSLDINLLNKFGTFFGVARGADLLVYISIIVLVYFYITLLNDINKQEITQTNIIRELSINTAKGNLGNTDTVFIIPAYGENDTPIKVIGEILQQGFAVIFIDDGKNGNLIEILRKNFNDKPIVTIKHVINLGQGGGLETGAEYIRRFGENIKYVVHFDADGQHRLNDLKNFQEAFYSTPNLEIALGSRFLGSTVNMPKSKKITLKLGIIFTMIFSGIKLTDTHNGYRMMKKETLDKIHITMNRMEHASEILDIIKQKGIKYKEVPITVIYSEYSINKGQKISNAFKIAKNLIYKKIFFR